MEEKILASLGGQLSKLSLEEARKAVADAQKILNSLKDQQKEAEKSVATANREVSKAKARQQGTSEAEAKKDQYSDKLFWENRYQDEQKKVSSTELYEWYLSFDEWKPTLIKQMELNQKSDLVLVSGCGNSSLCEDLIQAGFTNVAGFDYSPAVIATMQKRARSSKTIPSLSTIRYFVSDARSLPETDESKYSCIVDKGTLDAIASNSSNDNAEAGVEDAVRYMLEVWRVLRAGYRFLVLTTMPEEIFKSIAIEPLLSGEKGGKSSSSALPLFCEWESCGRVKLLTAEGGDVYFYSIEKLATPSRSQRDAILARLSARNAPAVAIDKLGKPDIMSGIEALLEEAKQAKIDMDIASQRCEARSMEARRCMDDLASAEKERSRLAQRLETGSPGEIEELTQQVATASTTGNVEARLSSSTPSASPSSVASLPALPVVALSINDDSTFVANGKLNITYTLQGGDWDEDDALYLVCVSPSSARPCEKSVAVGLYRENDSQQFETFEYATQPVSQAPVPEQGSGELPVSASKVSTSALPPRPLQEAYVQKLVGSVSISLPTYAAHYVVHYVRTSTTVTAAKIPAASENGKSDDANTSCVVRTSMVLCQSALFAVSAAVQHDGPDGPVAKSSSLIINDRSSSLVRRRGAAKIDDHLMESLIGDGEMAVPPFFVTVEELGSIKTLCVSLQYRTDAGYTGTPHTGTPHTGTPHTGTPYTGITRVMAWLHDLIGTPTASTVLIIEADIATLIPSTTSISTSTSDTSTWPIKTAWKVSSLRTRYYKLTIPINPGTVLDLTGAQVEVEMRPSSAHTTSDTDNSGHPVSTIICRIPYQSQEHSCCQKPSRELPFDNAMPQISCAFCTAPIVTHSTITKTFLLPSGVLDNVMHEFICSETTPNMTLCSADMTTEKGSTFYGPIQINCCPDDLISGTVSFACKGSSTLLDLFTGQGSGLATTPFSFDPSNPASLILNTSLIVNIDTCMINCARCGSYLGDGQLASDPNECPCPTHNAADNYGTSTSTSTSTPTTTPSTGTEEFTLGDLRDVRLARHCIELNLPKIETPHFPVPGCSPIRELEPRISCEQSLARALDHMNSVYTVTNFLIHTPSLTETRTAPKMSFIFLRILSKSYAVMLPEMNGRARSSGSTELAMQDGLKISYSVGTLSNASSSGLSITGNEARVLLEHSDFRQVVRILQARSVLFGSSFLKNQRISVLLK